MADTEQEEEADNDNGHLGERFIRFTLCSCLMTWLYQNASLLEDFADRYSKHLVFLFCADKLHSLFFRPDSRKSVIELHVDLVEDLISTILKFIVKILSNKIVFGILGTTAGHIIFVANLFASLHQLHECNTEIGVFVLDESMLSVGSRFSPNHIISANSDIQACYSSGGGIGFGIGSLVLSSQEEDGYKLVKFSISPNATTTISINHILDEHDHCKLNNPAVFDICFQTFHLPSFHHKDVDYLTQSIKCDHLNSHPPKVVVYIIPTPSLHFVMTALHPSKYHNLTLSKLTNHIANTNMMTQVKDSQRKNSLHLYEWIPNKVDIATCKIYPQCLESDSPIVLQAKKIWQPIGAFFMKEGFLHSYK